MGETDFCLKGGLIFLLLINAKNKAAHLTFSSFIAPIRNAFKSLRQNRRVTSIIKKEYINATKLDTYRSIMRFQVILACCVWQMLHTTVEAQSGKITFTGRVLDEETRQPVSYASVQLLSLPDSAFASGGVTKSDGRFTLSAALQNSKKQVLRISFIGYTTVNQPFTYTRKNGYTNIGDILLVPNGFMLDETIVTAKAPMAITENDTTVFNSSAYRTPEGSMLEDLVKQLPGGEITSEGKLMIHGKEVKKILVDGKEFFSDDPMTALKNLPVEMVEQLKAYERKSDLARLTGIDDGDEEMILDLSVKKGMKQGWMENFMGGVGSKGRYELANTLNRFRENSQFTVIGNWNNTNNQGFSELQQESSNASGNVRNQSGLTTSRSLGMNMSRDWERVKLRSNAQYSNTDRFEESRTTVDNYLRADKSITKSLNLGNNKNEGLTANAYLEWKIDSLTNLVFRPTFRYSSGNRTNNGSQKSWANEMPLNEKESNNLNDNSRYNLAFMLQVNRKLSRTGRNLALKLDYGSNTSSSGRLNYSTIRYLKNGTKKVQNQKIDTYGDDLNYRLQLVYVEPLPWTHFLQMRYSYQHKTANSDRAAYNWDEELGDFTEDPDTLNSNVFENQYSNHLLNFSVRTTRKMYNYNIGVDLEPQKSVSNSFQSDVLKHSLSRSVLNFSPTVNFRYKFSKRTRLQVTYRGKSRQPGMQDLQPIVDTTNPLNIRIGNPSLKPSYINTFNLNFNSYNAKHQRNIILQLMAENTINSVTNQVTYDSETDGRTTTPVNMNGNWRTEGSFSLSTPFKNSNWMFRTYTSLQYSNKNGYTTLNKEEPVKNSVRELIGRERLKLTYRTKQLEIGARGDVRYHYSYNKVKNIRSQTFDYQAGMDVQWYLPWGFEMYSDATYFLRSGYGLSEGRTNILWNCQLSKSLLKRKQLLLRFKVYDLLRQQTSLVRTMTTTAIRDTESNVLGSYFMLHAIVRLNMMGKR